MSNHLLRPVSDVMHEVTPDATQCSYTLSTFPTVVSSPCRGSKWKDNSSAERELKSSLSLSVLATSISSPSILPVFVDHCLLCLPSTAHTLLLCIWLFFSCPPTLLLCLPMVNVCMSTLCLNDCSSSSYTLMILQSVLFQCVVLVCVSRGSFSTLYILNEVLFFILIFNAIISLYSRVWKPIYIWEYKSQNK